MATALPVNGLTFEVFAAPFRSHGRLASVLLGIEVPGRALKLGAGETLELSYVAVDAQGNVRATDRNTITLDRVSAATRGQIERTGVRALNRLELPAGRYQLRVAAYETASGARGSVLYDLDVPDFADRALTMSGIAVTSVRTAEQPTPRFDDRLKNELHAVLPGPPGALRTFAPRDEMAAFVEAYIGGGSKVTTLTITTTVTSATGAVVFRADQPRKVADERCQVALRLPMTDLAPGTYTLTFTAESALPAGKTVARHVRFAVSDR